MIKKILFTLVLATSLIAPGFLLVGSAGAVDVLGGANGPCGNATVAAQNPACKDNATNASGSSNPVFGPNGIITTVVKFLSLVVGIIAVFVIVISGINFATSGGDSNQVAEARNSLIYALVGVLVAALGQVLVLFVLDKVQ